MAKGRLTWKGDIGKPEGQYTTTTVIEVIDAAALATLATALTSHTNCNLAQRTFVDEAIIDDSMPGGNVNVDRYAKIVLRHAANGKIRSFILAGPLAAEVVATPQGERLDPTALTAIATAVSTATGLTLNPVKGVVKQKQ